MMITLPLNILIVQQVNFLLVHVLTFHIIGYFCNITFVVKYGVEQRLICLTEGKMMIRC